MRYILKFDEAIKRKDIEELEREAQHLSKNILRIRNVDEWERVRNSFVQWACDFEDFVFKSLLKRSSHDTSEDNLRRSATQFSYFITSELFNPRYERSYSLSVEYGVHHFYKDDLTRYPLEGQLILFDSWLKHINSTYQKYNRFRREVFKSLYDYFDYFSKAGLMADLNQEIVDSILGVPISWRYDESEEEKYWFDLKSYIQFTKKALIGGITIIRNSPFSELLNGLLVEVETMIVEFGKGGEWHGLSQNKISLLSAFSNKDIPSVTRNFIHEVGHKYWDLLKKEDADFFLKMFSTKKVVIEKRHIDFLFSILTKVLSKGKVSSRRVYDLLDGGLHNYITDKEYLFIFELMVFNGVFEGEMYFSPEDIRAFEDKDFSTIYTRLRNLEGKVLGETVVTSYARTRAGYEAFPELFSYVLMGYDVPSTARKLFKAVTGV